MGHQILDPSSIPNPRDAGPAPDLNYRPLKTEEQVLLTPLVEQILAGQDVEAQAMSYAIAHLAPQHLREVRQQ